MHSVHRGHPDLKDAIVVLLFTVGSSCARDMDRRIVCMLKVRSKFSSQ